MISKTIYVKLFFKVNYMFFFSYCRLSVFKKRDFTQKILGYVETYLFKIKETSKESLYISSWSKCNISNLHDC